MASERPSRCTGIVHTQLFWDSLAGFRKGGQYESVRAKIRDFLRFRLSSDGLYPGEAPFVHGLLKGYLHIQLRKNPDVVLMHDEDGGKLVLLKVADHREYDFKGKNKAAGARNADLFERMDRTDVPNPGWDFVPRWKAPEDLSGHPDLAELSDGSLRRLLLELEEEAVNPLRLLRSTGMVPAALPPGQDIAYYERCERAHGVVSDVLDDRLRARRHHDVGTGWRRFG